MARQRSSMFAGITRLVPARLAGSAASANRSTGAFIGRHMSRAAAAGGIAPLRRRGRIRRLAP